MNLSICNNTSSTVLFDALIDLSASKRVIEVGFNSPILSYWQIENGSRLTLAPRLSNARSIL